MNKIQFQFKGGLGNQIFQYLASRYIKKKYSDISITYCFNNGLLGANRIFLLDSILKDSISLKKEYTKILPKLFSKIVDKAILISEIEKNKLKYKVNLYFDLYHECYLNYETIEKPLEKLLFDKMKLDPALMSSPFITTITDIAGVFIYLSTAKWL